MSDIIRAIILGAVQGLTEFLPISSSAHLIFVPWLFGWEPFGLAFDVALHLGTLSAVLIYFRHDLLAMTRGILGSWKPLLRGEMPDDYMGRLGLFIVLGSVPAAIVGLLAEQAIDDYFHSEPISRTALLLSAIAMVVMGVALGAADRWGQRVRGRDFNEIRLRDALLVGFAQSFALFPGVSRSGSTITAGLFAGLSRPVAARFSFLLGVPIVLGAGMKSVLDLVQEGVPADERTSFVAGVITAAIVGWLAIHTLIRYLQRHSTDVFVVYRIVMGVFIIGLLAAGFRG